MSPNRSDVNSTANDTWMVGSSPACGNRAELTATGSLCQSNSDYTVRLCFGTALPVRLNRKLSLFCSNTFNFSIHVNSDNRFSTSIIWFVSGLKLDFTIDLNAINPFSSEFFYDFSACRCPRQIDWNAVILLIILFSSKREFSSTLKKNIRFSQTPLPKNSLLILMS